MNPRESIDFDAIEGWLADPRLFGDPWVTEQALHALGSTIHGVEFLPPHLDRVDTGLGLAPEAVCKHYPDFFRTGLDTEGVARLVRRLPRRPPRPARPGARTQPRRRALRASRSKRTKNNAKPAGTPTGGDAAWPREGPR